jgi:ammonium transporter Rh
MESLDKDDDYQHDPGDRSKAFVYTLGAFQVMSIVIFWSTMEYGNSQDEIKASKAGLATDVSTYYSFYSNVAFMIWIGFGYLMTFLRKYSFSAVGFNMLFSSVAFEWGIIVMNWFHQAHTGTGYHVLQLSISWLIEGCFAAGAVMITFGAVLGKISPLQMFFVTIFEIVFYALNFYIGALTLKAIDVGGSMFVHSFGAYFGVALTLAIAPKRSIDDEGNPVAHEFNGSRTTTDVTAMIGTIFLWLLWPSFNGALAPVGTQFRVIVNTVLALNGSCISSFLFSRLFSHEGKFDMVHIQNATLAGGVAVGSSADLVIGPGGAITVGVIAGFLSTAGYVFVTPYLERKFGLDDTCGVHNLHGMPGVLGGLSGAISAAAASASVYGVDFGTIFNGRSPGVQAGYQLAALAVTLALALFGGWFTGKIVNCLTNCIPGVQNHGQYPKGYFEDEPYWETCHDYHLA